MSKRTTKNIESVDEKRPFSFFAVMIVVVYSMCVCVSHFDFCSFTGFDVALKGTAGWPLDVVMLVSRDFIGCQGWSKRAVN